MKRLKSPFPWFGGKSSVAHLVWERFGDVPNYVEPFFGSGAVLLARPLLGKRKETVNDKDGFVANFWRALKHAPEDVARHFEHPLHENELHARHGWLVRECLPTLASKLEGNPDWFDAKVAGYWAWGVCNWIGSGWCSGKGPWKQVDFPNRTRQFVYTGCNDGLGTSRQLPSLGREGTSSARADLLSSLSRRLENVRVACGDWSRVVTNCCTIVHGTTGVFLDPPYSVDDRAETYSVDDRNVSKRAFEWAVSNGGNRKLLIAFCGYEGEHEFPDDWSVVQWKANGGYANQSGANVNARRERIWFSPHCKKLTRTLFD